MALELKDIDERSTVRIDKKIATLDGYAVGIYNECITALRTPSWKRVETAAEAWRLVKGKEIRVSLRGNRKSWQTFETLFKSFDPNGYKQIEAELQDDFIQFLAETVHAEF